MKIGIFKLNFVSVAIFFFFFQMMIDGGRVGLAGRVENKTYSR